MSHNDGLDLSRDTVAAVIVVVEAVIDGTLGVKALTEVRDRLLLALGGPLRDTD